MTVRKNVIKAGLAALMVLATTAGAFAWSATATTSVNVRSGPGTNYRVVDVLQRGERVHVDYCRGSWCFVEKRGPNGWVSVNYLSRGGHYRPAPPPVYRPAPRPPVYRPAPRPPVYRPAPRPPVYRPGPSRPGYVPPHQRGGNVGGQVCFDGPGGYVCVGR